MNNRMKNRN